MRRFWPMVAAAVIALLAVGVLVLAPGGPQAAEPADALARELRCPDCQGLSVADSPTQSAAEIRRQIDEMLAAGASPEEVRGHFVARYGEWILLAPSAPLLWAIPLVLVLAALATLAFWLSRARTTPGSGASALSAETRRRLRDEAEALDV